MRSLGLFLLASAVSAHLRVSKRDETAQQALEPAGEASPASFTGSLGPLMPGNEADCQVTLVSAQDPAKAVSMSSWLAELRSSAQAQQAEAYAAGMRRLCGDDRFSPAKSPFQAVVPSDATARAGIIEALGTLKSSCQGAGSEGDESTAQSLEGAYAQAFNKLCPVPPNPGPEMPEGCDYSMPSLKSGDSNRVQLQFFFEQLRDGLSASDDGVWGKGIRQLCGAEVSSSGTPWANHAPYTGTSSQKSALKFVDDLRYSCGLEARNPGTYRAAWEGLCQGEPSEGEGDPVAMSCDETVRTLEKRVKAVQVAVSNVKTAAQVALPLISDKDSQQAMNQAINGLEEALTASAE